MSWFDIIRKRNKYEQAKVDQISEAHMDPQVQLDMAIDQAKKNADTLKKNAASVVSSFRQAEAKLHDLVDEQARLENSASAALKQQNQPAARAFATQLVTVKAQVESQKTFVEQAHAAAEQAKDAVVKNGEVLQETLSKRQKVMAQLDQAKMQESMNSALEQITSTTADHDVPSFAEVEAKVNKRYSDAVGTTEIDQTDVGYQQMDVHHAELQSQADAELAALSAKLGLPQATS